MKTLHIRDGIAIPESEVRFAFSRSGGPGGQNVNKVESRVELLYNIDGSSVLSERQREQVRSALSSRIDREGNLRIVAQRSRSQRQNRDLALTRFVELMRGALERRKKRIPTRLGRAAGEKRRQEKKERSEVKKLRSRISRE